MQSAQAQAAQQQSSAAEDTDSRQELIPAIHRVEGWVRTWMGFDPLKLDLYLGFICRIGAWLRMQDNSDLVIICALQKLCNSMDRDSIVNLHRTYAAMNLSFGFEGF